MRPTSHHLERSTPSKCACLKFCDHEHNMSHAFRAGCGGQAQKVRLNAASTQRRPSVLIQIKVVDAGHAHVGP
jgi:hypothetical protein